MKHVEFQSNPLTVTSDWERDWFSSSYNYKSLASDYQEYPPRGMLTL